MVEIKIVMKNISPFCSSRNARGLELDKLTIYSTLAYSSHINALVA
jgi:hypothetical protein